MTLALWLKAVHIMAAIIWAGASLAAAALAARARTVPPEALYAWFRRWVSTAMIVALVAGLATAQLSGFWSATWLQVKLVLIVVLTGLHGGISGVLRRQVADPAKTMPYALLWTTAATVTGIVGMAVLRPF